MKLFPKQDLKNHTMPNQNHIEPPFGEMLCSQKRRSRESVFARHKGRWLKDCRLGQDIREQHREVRLSHSEGLPFYMWNSWNMFNSQFHDASCHYKSRADFLGNAGTFSTKTKKTLATRLRILWATEGVLHDGYAIADSFLRALSSNVSAYFAYFAPMFMCLSHVHQSYQPTSTPLRSTCLVSYLHLCSLKRIASVIQERDDV